MSSLSYIVCKSLISPGPDNGSSIKDKITPYSDIALTKYFSFS
jgi:hypothetical protein